MVNTLSLGVVCGVDVRVIELEESEVLAFYLRTTNIRWVKYQIKDSLVEDFNSIHKY